MSVLTARRLMVLLVKRLRSSGHRNNAVKSKVMKLWVMRVCDSGTRERRLQIVGQEGGRGNKLETDMAYTISDSGYVT